MDITRRDFFHLLPNHKFAKNLPTTRYFRCHTSPQTPSPSACCHSGQNHPRHRHAYTSPIRLHPDIEPHRRQSIRRPYPPPPKTPDSSGRLEPDGKRVAPCMCSASEFPETLGAVDSVGKAHQAQRDSETPARLHGHARSREHEWLAGRGQ